MLSIGSRTVSDDYPSLAIDGTNTNSPIQSAWGSPRTIGDFWQNGLSVDYWKQQASQDWTVAKSWFSNISQSVSQTASDVTSLITGDATDNQDTTKNSNPISSPIYIPDVGNITGAGVIYWGILLGLAFVVFKEVKKL